MRRQSEPDYLSALGSGLATSQRQVLGVIRAMDTINFPSVCFWLGQIAAKKCLC